MASQIRELKHSLWFPTELGFEADFHREVLAAQTRITTSKSTYCIIDTLFVVIQRFTEQCHY